MAIDVPTVVYPLFEREPKVNTRKEVMLVDRKVRYMSSKALI